MRDSPAAWTSTDVEVPGPDGPLVIDVWTLDGGATDGESGAPHTVLALHGFPQSARSWQAVGERLAGHGLRVVAPTQRGYAAGARPAGVEPYRMPHLVADALAVADAVDAPSFHLLGHDWGAQVGWSVCAVAPERVRSFTAVSVPHPRAYATAYAQDADQREAAAYIGMFWQPGTGEEWLSANDWAMLRRMLAGLPEAEVEHYVTRLSEPGAATAALAWYRAMESAADFPSTRVPTTYLWSTGDLALRRRGAELCGDFVDADYRYVELEGVSHWVPDEAPDAVVDAVLDRVGRA